MNSNSINMKKDLYKKIKKGVSSGVLSPTFSVNDVNQSLNNLLGSSPSFLSKHCIGNPDKNSEMFIRQSRGVYKLNPNFSDNSTKTLRLNQSRP